jgi:predicted  nucleic acid-binding Zn-ribbon protein
MPDEENGRAKSRLERIEGFIEAVASQQAVMQAELSRLLKAQVVFQDSLHRHQAASEARFQRIETNLAEATDKINALVDLMNRHLTEPHPRPESQ